MIDGKSFGPFLSNGAVVYSGDSNSYGFLASEGVRRPSTFYLNGIPQTNENSITNVFRAGETGDLYWIEHKLVKVADPRDPTNEINTEYTRLAHVGGATDWFERIEKMNFSDDGSLFSLRISERVKVDEAAKTNTDAPTARDYIIHADGSKILRAGMVQVFPAPNSQGYASLNSENYVNFRGKNIKFNGEFYGKPAFSPDGKTFAFRNSFTGPTKDGRNIPFYQYNINGFSITDLQVQTGLTFAPDGKKWVMCGLNGKDPYLYVSNQGMTLYSEFPGLGSAPPELYKEARFVNGKIVLLFQPKKSRPVLFIEDRGTFDLVEMMSAPETLSISPDGKTLLLGCSDKGELHAFAMSLENPGLPTDLLKKSYDLQNLGKGTFIWKNDHEVQFMILRNSEMVRVSATL